MTRRSRASSLNVASDGQVWPERRSGAAPPGASTRLVLVAVEAPEVCGTAVGSGIAVSLLRAELPAVEARPRPGVAGDADLVAPDEQGVPVAVEGDALDQLGVAGGVALAPVLLAAAGPEGHPTGGEGAVERLIVHPADHEDLGGVELLDDGTDQAVAVALQLRGHRGVQGGDGG